MRFDAGIIYTLILDVWEEQSLYSHVKKLTIANHA